MEIDGYVYKYVLCSHYVNESIIRFLAFLVRMLFKRKAASKKVSEGYEVKEQCLVDDSEGKEV